MGQTGSSRRASMVIALGGALAGCFGPADDGRRRWEPFDGGDSYGSPADLGAQGSGRFLPTVTQETPPPPISGGTLMVTRDGTTAVAADPDRDRAWFVALDSLQVRATVVFERGDEPGRVADDRAG